MLASSPRYQEVLRRFDSNAARIGAPTIAFELEEKGLIAEGLAFNRGRWFISSVHAKKVFAIDASGRASTFAENLPWGAFGLAVDRKRGVLWVASSALPQAEGFRPEDEGKAALVALDLRSGAARATLRPREEGKHLFGDVTVAPDGEVFVTDSASPVVYRVENDALVPFAQHPFRSLQGVAATSRLLYVSDYGHGLFAIDRATHDVIALTLPDDVSLLGVDGIYRVDDRTLVAVQNGTSPMRVLRLGLSANGLAITSAKTLVANHPLMTDATLGTIVDGAFHWIGNAQWDAWDEKGLRNEKVVLEPVRVLRLRP